VTFFDYGVIFINTMGAMLTSIYVFYKSINHPSKSAFVVPVFVWCLPVSAILPFLATHLTQLRLLFLIPVYIIAIFLLWKLAKVKLDTAIAAYLTALGISYVALFISTFVLGSLFGLFLFVSYEERAFVNADEPVYLLLYVLIAALQFFVSYILFRVKRFKKGFPFLTERYAVIAALILTGAILAVISLITFPRDIHEYDNAFYLSLITGVLISGIGIIIWVRRGIKLFYIRKMKERSIEMLERDIADKEREIQLLVKQNDILRVASHKVNFRLAALERGIAKLLAEKAQSRILSAETSEEIAFALDDIKRLSEDYQHEVSRTGAKKPLPSAKVKMIDDLFAYFSEQCADSDVDFALKTSGSIPYMAERIIPQGRLETMLGDHLRNALTAVSASENSFRSILAVLGLAGDFYELSIFDSGIPFKADTLHRLGTERATTRADAGGSGIGFMTTFETMKEFGASLVISEKEPSNTDYTKSVTIRFDGKCQYIIETYRPGEFPGDGNRYTLKSR
jgi:signal transduction histidine kinase